MQSRNPVFNNSKAFKDGGYASFNEAPPATAEQLQEMYSAPSATSIDTGRMTMDDVVVKTGLMFAVLLPLAAFNFWQQNNLLTIGGVIVGLVLGSLITSVLIWAQRGTVQQELPPDYFTRVALSVIITALLAGFVARGATPGDAESRLQTLGTNVPGFGLVIPATQKP